MRLVRGLLGVIAGLLLLVSVALSVLRNIETSSRVLTMATSFASYAIVGYLLVLVILVLLVGKARKASLARLGAGLAVVGLLVHGWWLAPLYVGPGSGIHADLTVMTSNLEFGAGDPNTVVRAATDRHVDVLVLEEVTPFELKQLQDSGLSQLLPRSAGTPATSASGTMVFSRFPLRGVGAVSLTNGGLSVTVGAPKPFR
ncbi:MAG: hypothetical protein M3Y66_09675, partial [Actinomycetota bacterium]|nr:hypothetical protein [Actinomycetota bacterium]